MTFASSLSSILSKATLRRIPSEVISLTLEIGKPKCRYFSSKVSALSLTSKKRKGKKITMVTAYDFPSAVHCARAGIDVILMGDSIAMVEMGFETTQPIGMDQMIWHSASVKRGIDFAASRSDCPTPLLVGDMPFGSYEYDDSDVALKNAYRFVKEAGVDAVKLEGGSLARARTAEKIVQGGVAVMGHIGLTPQAISVIGGFRAQGRTAARARTMVDEALRLQDAGCFAIVLECVPHNVAEAITETLEVPTIGIGAGGGTSGQVLVFHDMLGMLSHPHHDQFVPKFCKKYSNVGHMIQEGLQQYKKDVESGEFPGSEYSPYVMKDEERQAFEALLSEDVDEREQKHRRAAEKYVQTDEYEKLSLYGGGGNGNTKKSP
mmetsp:Transcript_5857/g.11467  ORF Transcript_5857/g.11467 Transcript_5857/m.11467 type:complete len:377 (+) Transcript_5857:190-1320(+)